MIKPKTQFICQSCGSVYTRWIGKCEQCNQWNTLLENDNSKPSGILSRSSGRKINFEKLEKPKTTVKKITKSIKEKNIYCRSGFPFKILNERSSSLGSQQLIFFLESRN